MRWQDIPVEVTYVGDTRGRADMLEHPEPLLAMAIVFATTS
jgi:hypothetical protein